MRIKIRPEQARAYDYAHAMAALVRSRITELSTAEFKLCAYVYACMEDEGGRVTASTAELAAATGLSRRTVQICRTQLVNKGFLILVSTGCERGVYDLPNPPLSSADPADAGPPDPVPQDADPPQTDPPETGTQTELHRIACLIDTLGGKKTPTSAVVDVAGGCTSTLLLALESMMEKGDRFDPGMPQLFLSAVAHRVNSLMNS